MNDLLELMPWFITMAVLIGCSAFFSASEASLFYLRPSDRRQLHHGKPSERRAARLLEDPDRLLSSVLFWNLSVNILYFAVASVCAIRIEQQMTWGGSASVAFALMSLLAIIFFSEMMPKSLAVTKPRSIARLVSLPLSFFVRVADPIMPVLRGTTLVAQRLLLPGFRSEPYLDIIDLERAIDISGQDESIIKQEQAVLQNIVQLSEIRVDEWMRPRNQFLSFTPPVSLESLQGRITPSGYILINEPGSVEIQKAIRLDDSRLITDRSIEDVAEPVMYLPWSSTVAVALEQMARDDYNVTAVINEYGETIGVLTVDDILESVFVYEPSRIKRILDLNPIHIIEPGKWVVSGMMSLRRLCRYFGIKARDTQRSVTIGGIVQESLQRLANKGDTCEWGPFHFVVIEAPEKGTMLLELHYSDDVDMEQGE